MFCRFDQCSVSPLSLKGIKDAGFEKMTVVQEATLPVILKGLFSTVPCLEPSECCALPDEHGCFLNLLRMSPFVVLLIQLSFIAL